MKGLGQFLSFDWDRFATGKVFAVSDTSDYVDYDTKQHLGTKVTCIILSDKTKYEPTSDGKTISNQYEKIIFKVRGKDLEALPKETKVVPKVEKATVFGDYHNQLSVKCTDLVPADKQ